MPPAKRRLRGGTPRSDYEIGNAAIFADCLAWRNRPGGHPLAGWRSWQVREAGGDIILETFSVEHAATGYNSFQLDWGGLTAMNLTWTNMLGDLVDYSGGNVVYGPDTVIGGENRTNRLQQYLPLVE